MPPPFGVHELNVCTHSEERTVQAERSGWGTRRALAPTTATSRCNKRRPRTAVAEGR